MNWQAIARAIQMEAAYWMALTVAPNRDCWVETFRYFYRRGDDPTPYGVPFIIDFGRELEGIS